MSDERNEPTPCAMVVIPPLKMSPAPPTMPPIHDPKSPPAPATPPSARCSNLRTTSFGTMSSPGSVRTGTLSPPPYPGILIPSAALYFIILCPDGCGIAPSSSSSPAGRFTRTPSSPDGESPNGPNIAMDALFDLPHILDSIPGPCSGGV